MNFYAFASTFSSNTSLKSIQNNQARATNTNEQFAPMNANGIAAPAVLFELIEASCLFVFVHACLLNLELV